jgi:hypothetical protein
MPRRAPARGIRAHIVQLEYEHERTGGERRRGDGEDRGEVDQRFAARSEATPAYRRALHDRDHPRHEDANAEGREPASALMRTGRSGHKTGGNRTHDDSPG